MLLALGAASSAIDALQALTSSKSSSAKSTGVSQPSSFDFFSSSQGSASTGTSGGSGGSQISPETMSALLAAQSQSSTGAPTSTPTSRSDALKDLFSQIDADGDGKITKSEFENALGAGGTNLAQADDVFSKLDKDGDGSVSLDEMSQALKGGKGGGHHHHHHAASDASSAALELRPADAGAAGRLQHFRHQQRRFDDDVDDLCGRIQGHDDLGRVRQLVERRNLVLQFHRADDPAPGQGDLVFGHRFALGQRLRTKR